MSAVVTQEPTVARHPSLLAKLGERFGVEPAKMLSTLKATAFRVKEGPEVSNEQMMALLVVADQYGLNPWTKEIYAFPDKHNGIVPVVGVDGWLRIINSHPEFDGLEFVDGPCEEKSVVPAWIECVIHRKDRAHPTRAREYMAECRRNTGPWQSHPRRMLRHKALIQCSRVAFGYTGIYDPDEAERMGETVVPDADKTVADINARLAKRRPDAPAGDEVTDATIVESEAVAAAKPAAAAAKETDAPTMTHAQVAELLTGAKDREQLDEAAAKIDLVANPEHREELQALYRARLEEIA